MQNLEPWKSHPIFAMGDNDVPLDKTIPLCVHGDGAQFYREDENFVFSISSVFAPAGVVSDVLLFKFPVMIIPERYMRSESVPHQTIQPFCVLFLGIMNPSHSSIH